MTLFAPRPRLSVVRSVSWTCLRPWEALNTSRAFTPSIRLSKKFGAPDASNIGSFIETSKGQLDLDTFRQIAWTPKIPLLLKQYHDLPATTRWFEHKENGSWRISEDLESLKGTFLPYEFMATTSQLTRLQRFLEYLRGLPPEETEPILNQFVASLIDTTDGTSSSFSQFDAPLSLFFRALRFNSTRTNSSDRIQQLYIAQSDINSLPDSLKSDISVPEIVQRVGKGDIYSSSIWLGLMPTYTPLHRDPNPNLFCQLIGQKTVRLMRPSLGSSLYSRVQKQLGSFGSSRFRGTEMMSGPERDLMHRAVWLDAPASCDLKEACLGPGDALFIPQGWWHSVISVGEVAELNASVNWWFR
ncbi:Clavaminate synthase-like protein [Xylariaceae sp. FL0016]|nr:Clavaminate synthase-like protein [Xylariaceae sp. FL0016]